MLGRRGVPRLDRFNDTRQPVLGTPLLPVVDAQTLADHLAVHHGILAHIERDQVKAERGNTSQQSAHGEKTRVLSFVRLEAVLDQLDIGLKLRRALVG